jgi:hypothetical protein
LLSFIISLLEDLIVDELFDKPTETYLGRWEGDESVFGIGQKIRAELTKIEVDFN